MGETIHATLVFVPFPPSRVEHIVMYGDDDIVAGYRECRPDELFPGDNYPPGYRWGWLNRIKDRTGKQDGYEGLRREYFRWSKARQ